MARHPSCRRPLLAGITFKEVLFVAALALVGAWILWFVGSRSNDGKLTTDCKRNLKLLYMGLAMYSEDHNGALPPYTNMEAELAKKAPNHFAPTTSDEPTKLRESMRLYTDDPNWFCPSDPVKKQNRY